jgi:hypothetical protein
MEDTKQSYYSFTTFPDPPEPVKHPTNHKKLIKKYAKDNNLTIEEAKKIIKPILVSYIYHYSSKERCNQCGTSKNVSSWRAASWYEKLCDTCGEKKYMSNKFY